jgi:hypothetical protein
MEIVYEYKKSFKGINYEIDVLYDTQLRNYVIGIRNNEQLLCIFFFNEDEMKDFLNSLQDFYLKRREKL